MERPGIVQPHGRHEAAIPRLDAFFSRIEGGVDHPNLDIGNEPSFSQPWIYNSARQPWKTQDVVHRVVTQRFAAAPSGYPGDDDLGSMSSWLVWAYLGMYPMIPGTDVLVLGTPRFTSATLRLRNGQTVQINAPGASAAAHFTQSVTVNASPTQRSWLRFADIAGGATLGVQTGTSPNTGWGSQPGNEPPSFDVGTSPPPPGSSSPAAASSSAATGAAAGESGVEPASDRIAVVQRERGAGEGGQRQRLGGNTDKWCSTAAGTKFSRSTSAPSQSLGSFTVRHAGAGGESTAANTRDFDLQVSANGTTFTTVAQVRGNTASVSTHQVTASGRYIRLNVINPEQGAGGAARIYEFEAYAGGSPPPPGPPPPPPPPGPPPGTWR